MSDALDNRVREFIQNHRVARLATAGADRQPSVVPICYAFYDENLYTPIDEKPKATAANELKRIRNIEENPRVSMVIDDYSDDWTQLAYVLISATAQIITPAGQPAEHAQVVDVLREKYPQYRLMAIDRRPIIKLIPTRFKYWASAASGKEHK